MFITIINTNTVFTLAIEIQLIQSVFSLHYIHSLIGSVFYKNKLNYINAYKWYKMCYASNAQDT